MRHLYRWHKKQPAFWQTITNGSRAGIYLFHLYYSKAYFITQVRYLCRADRSDKPEDRLVYSDTQFVFSSFAMTPIMMTGLIWCLRTV